MGIEGVAVMAWGWYLNMEPMALECAKAHVALMTNDNYTEEYLDTEGTERKPDSAAFLNNVQNGFMACVLTACYFESSINTLLRDGLGYDPDGIIIRGNEKSKVEIIGHGKEEELERIKSMACWRDYHRLKKMRNALVHYKNNDSCSMSSWPPLNSWKIENEIVSDFFTRSNVAVCVERTEDLICELAELIDWGVNPFLPKLASSGSFGGYAYLCRKDEVASLCEEFEAYKDI